MLQCSLREGFLEHVKDKRGISLVAFLLDLPDLVISGHSTSFDSTMSSAPIGGEDLFPLVVVTDAHLGSIAISRGSFAVVKRLSPSFTT